MWLFVMHDYQRQRVLMLFDPESDKLGAGWNIIQSQTAIGSGGWARQGLATRHPVTAGFSAGKPHRFHHCRAIRRAGLPRRTVLLCIYLLIVARGLWISWHAQETFGRLLGSAISITFFLYVFVNMGMVAGLLTRRRSASATGQPGRVLPSLS
jgi:rod shape determining protein RodA